jgi:hypothetical protein
VYRCHGVLWQPWSRKSSAYCLGTFDSIGGECTELCNEGERGGSILNAEGRT